MATPLRALGGLVEPANSRELAVRREIIGRGNIVLPATLCTSMLVLPSHLVSRNSPLSA